MMDVTGQWRDVVRELRQRSSVSDTPEGAKHAGERLRMGSAAEALGISRWQTPMSSFMQQATELNYSVDEMHTFLLQHFFGYVDIHHHLPSQAQTRLQIGTATVLNAADLFQANFLRKGQQSRVLQCLLQILPVAPSTPVQMKRSLMSDEDRDMIDLEVTSFMTACDAGVGALKALLQKERLRRMEQEASVRRETGWEEDGRGGLGGSVQAELRPGSRPAHEHAAVTFLFERLRAVAEVAETMQNERRKRETSRKARFYGGPATQRPPGVAERGGDISIGSPPSVASEGIWEPTSEELEEERILEESYPAAYGSLLGNTDEVAEAESQRIGDTAEATPCISKPPLKKPGSSIQSSGAGRRRSGEQGTRTLGDDRKPSGGMSISGRGLNETRGVSAEEQADDYPMMSQGALELENRDLVARFQNELDDARLVETKMSEISGLMGLFASKVVEQQGGMEHVFDVAVSVNDKLERGGRHLERALERGSAFRYFYTWFMVGASLCLLFLHFYRP